MSALSVDLLMKAGMMLGDAAREVAKILNRNGVTVHGGGGNRVTGTTVINWRNRVRADDGKGFGAEIYEDLRGRIAFVDGVGETTLRADILQRLERLLLETRAGDERPLHYAT